MHKNAESAFLFNRKQEFRKKCVEKCRKKCVEKCKIRPKFPWKNVGKSVGRPRIVGNRRSGKSNNALLNLPKIYLKKRVYLNVFNRLTNICGIL